MLFLDRAQISSLVSVRVVSHIRNASPILDLTHTATLFVPQSFAYIDMSPSSSSSTCPSVVLLALDASYLGSTPAVRCFTRTELVSAVLNCSHLRSALLSHAFACPDLLFAAEGLACIRPLSSMPNLVCLSSSALPQSFIRPELAMFASNFLSLRNTLLLQGTSKPGTCVSSFSCARLNLLLTILGIATPDLVTSLQCFACPSLLITLSGLS